MAVILTEYHHEKEQEAIIIKLLLTSFLAYPFFIGLRVSEEKYQLSKARALLVKFMALGFFVVYYFFGFGEGLENPAVIFRFVAMLLFGHLYISLSAFREYKDLKDFWSFNQKIFLFIIEGAVVSAIIFGGLALALLALQELFKVDVSTYLYMDLFLVIAGIFHPLYFLSKLPNPGSGLESTYERYPAFSNVVKYVLIPLVGLYFIILYAFSAKILFTWELPEGWVSKMVLGFSVAGIFTYLVNYRMAEHEDSSILSGFRKWYFPVLAPMVLLIMVAIWRRISDYGFTEPRYIVFVLGIWVGLLSLYFIISKKDDIRVIPFSLAILALISITGPWSAQNVSFNDQLDRLKTTLQNEGLLEGTTFKEANKVVEPEVTKEITSMLEYLTERDTAALRSEFDLTKVKEMDIRSIMDEMGLEPNYARGFNRDIEYRHFLLKSDLPVSTEDFQYFKSFQLYNFNKDLKRIINLDEEGKTAILHTSTGEEIDIPLERFCMKIFKNSDGDYDLSTLSLPFARNQVKGKIVFEELSLVKEGMEFKIQSARGTVLWSE
jgi:hypothetical protein